MAADSACCSPMPICCGPVTPASQTVAGAGCCCAPCCGCSIVNAVTDPRLRTLQQAVIAYASAHGISMVSDAQSGLLMHAPVTLLPTPLDESSYKRVAALTPLWNTLVDRLSRDEEFLLSHLEQSAKADPWLARLMEILKQLRSEGRALTQPIRLGVLRSDYMIHVEESTNADGATLRTHTPLQVELNTISASFMGLSTRVAAMHRFMLEREMGVAPAVLDALLPQNLAVEGVAAGMACAFELYKKQHPSPQLVIVMVVQPGESNAIDQRILEYTLWKNHSIPVIRRTLLQIAETSSFDAEGQLLFPPETAVSFPSDSSSNGAAAPAPAPAAAACLPHIAAVVYFRAGYTPRDYPSDREFHAIYLAERSIAIKCPSLAVHLAGTKKIQQVLAEPGMVERFLPEGDDAQRLRACFAGLYALEKDDAATLAVIDCALSRPLEFVLKPQREGGGNNLWQSEMQSALRRMKKEERAAYILMKKIDPRPTRAALLRKGELLVADALSELGIYSTYVSDGHTESHSALCGHLLRTKAVGVDEGGVAAGFSCLSSVIYQ